MRKNSFLLFIFSVLTAAVMGYLAGQKSNKTDHAQLIGLQKDSEELHNLKEKFKQFNDTEIEAFLKSQNGAPSATTDSPQCPTSGDCKKYGKLLAKVMQLFIATLDNQLPEDQVAKRQKFAKEHSDRLPAHNRYLKVNPKGEDNPPPPPAHSEDNGKQGSTITNPTSYVTSAISQVYSNVNVVIRHIEIKRNAVAALGIDPLGNVMGRNRNVRFARLGQVTDLDLKLSNFGSQAKILSSDTIAFGENKEKPFAQIENVSYSIAYRDGTLRKENQSFGTTAYIGAKALPDQKVEMNIKTFLLRGIAKQDRSPASVLLPDSPKTILKPNESLVIYDFYGRREIRNVSTIVFEQPTLNPVAQFFRSEDFLRMESELYIFLSPVLTK